MRTCPKALRKKVMKSPNSLLLTAAVAGLIFGASQVHASSSEATKAVGECHGVNACKGHGECAGNTNSCTGKNSCKGMGWIKASKTHCTKQGGKFKKMVIK